MPGSNFSQQNFGFRGRKLQNPASFPLNQMKMVAVPSRLVAGPPTAKIPALQNTLGLQQPYRAVDRGQRNTIIEGIGAAVQLIHIWMVGRLREYTGNNPARASHLQPVRYAQALDAYIHLESCELISLSGPAFQSPQHDNHPSRT